MSAKIYTKCIVCGEDLIQGSELKEYKCSICGKVYISDYSCRNGHNICSICAVKEFYEIAKTVCMKTKSKNPLEIADMIMSHPNFTIVGCKHYIVAPLALFTAYKNCGGKINDFEKSLDIVKETAMSSQVSLCRVGGLCGIPISCGRAMYATDPGSSDKEKAKVLSNKFAAYCMRAITNPENLGSSDCCKRNVYITIISGTKFIRDYLWVDLELPTVLKCRYADTNPRCNQELCRLYKGRNLMKYY